MFFFVHKDICKNIFNITIVPVVNEGLAIKVVEGII
jgi:hypothetical protein